MQLTNIKKNESAEAMKKMALALFPTIQWRHHGIGVLQGYVAEDCEPEVRLHIWSPSLVKPGMTESGDIHDHRFDMVSHVLYGQVCHEQILPKEDGSGEWSMLRLTHARAAKDTGYHGPTAPIAGRYSITRQPFVITEGYSYTYPAARFHRSPVLPGIAVTCVEKHNQSDASARILHPSHIPIVFAFGHDMDWKVVGPVLEEARKALAR
jgi:hypothetical protein